MREARPYHVAVVHSRRGVLLVSVAETPAQRDRDLAAYVRDRAERQLAPRTREMVLAQLDRGMIAAAIETYFEAVGREWDEEWVYLEVVARVPSAPGGRLPMQPLAQPSLPNP